MNLAHLTIAQVNGVESVLLDPKPAANAVRKALRLPAYPTLYHPLGPKMANAVRLARRKGEARL